MTERMDTMPITVWEKPQCMQCAAVRRTLDSKGVSYDHMDLTDPANAEQLRKFVAAGFKQAPIVQTPEETFAGFDPGKLEAAVTHARNAEVAADMTGATITGPDSA